MYSGRAIAQTIPIPSSTRRTRPEIGEMFASGRAAAEYAADPDRR